jgi:hypothetical protein
MQVGTLHGRALLSGDPDLHRDDDRDGGESYSPTSASTFPLNHSGHIFSTTGLVSAKA